jgi:hypothetical protein
LYLKRPGFPAYAQSGFEFIVSPGGIVVRKFLPDKREHDIRIGASRSTVTGATLIPQATGGQKRAV